MRDAASCQVSSLTGSIVGGDDNGDEVRLGVRQERLDDAEGVAGPAVVQLGKANGRDALEQAPGLDREQLRVAGANADAVEAAVACW